MNIAFDYEKLAEAASRGPLSEDDLRASVQRPPVSLEGPAGLALAAQPGLTDLIKSAAVEIISIPKLEQRRAKFRNKLSSGYGGPIIVAEGDSWFLYPIRLTDVIGHLDDEFAIWDEALPADTIARMLQSAWSLKAIVAYRRPQILLIGGGANDLLGDESLARYLEGGDLPRPGDYLGARYKGFVQEVLGKYRRLLAEIRQVKPDLSIIVHGYDYAVPQPGGSWLGRPMDILGIPSDPAKRSAIVKAMIDHYNGKLAQLATAMGNMRHVDLRGTLRAAEWFDELHPTSAGFEKIARKIRQAILAVHPVVAAADVPAPS